MARLGRSFPRQATIVRWRGETQAPTYSVAPHSTQLGDTTATFSATGADELWSTVDHFMGVYAAGSTPNESQVVAGTGTGFVASSNRSNLAVANGATNNFTQHTGLTINTSYRAAFTMRDAVGNLTAVTYVDFSTTKQIVASGIASAEAFGVANVGKFIAASGIASSEAFGSASIAAVQSTWSDTLRDQTGAVVASTTVAYCLSTTWNGPKIDALDGTFTSNGSGVYSFNVPYAAGAVFYMRYRLNSSDIKHGMKKITTA